MRGWLRGWLRRYLSAGGRVIWVAAAISLVAGLDPYRGQFGGIFLLTFGLTLSSLVVAWWVKVRLEGELRAPARAVAGSVVRLTVVVRNLSRRAGYDVEATLDRVLPGLGVPKESARIDVLAPGESVTLEVQLEAKKRGVYLIGPAYAGTTYPLGIVRLGNALGKPQRLLVTPRIFALAALRLHSGQRHQPGGVPLASQTGESMEFVGVRDYRQGDSPRKIHWKLWARRGEPVVREYSQEYFSRIGLILDTYRPPRQGDFEAGLELLASLAAYLERSDSIVDFFAAGPELYLLSMGRNLGSLERVLELLASMQPCKTNPYEQVEERFRQLLARLSALVVVSYGPSPEREQFWQRLRQLGVPLRILVVDRQAPPAAPDVTWVDAHAPLEGLVL